MIVLVVNGYPRSGKDTLCDIIESKYKVVRFSTVDTPKRVLYMLGWNGDKSPQFRDALSDIKDLYTRLFDGPFMEATFVITGNQDADFVTIMCREPDEIDKLKKWCSDNGIECYTVLVDRSSMVEDISNHADSNVLYYKYDIVVDNRGDMETFKDKVLTMASSLMGVG